MYTQLINDVATFLLHAVDQLLRDQHGYVVELYQLNAAVII